ncbi:MAG: LacI family transcriptional regulator [Lachnospiraceae bacterium]|nr:LacI family transcriptional regulator [Lachnospiraceae bacterium]
MPAKTGNRSVTLDDIAASLGLSKTTISRVISGKGRIGDETRARVLAYIGENGYRPNIIAKSLAESKTYNICVVLPNDLNLADMPFFQNIQLGICECLLEQNYDVILTTIDNNLGGQLAINNLARIISNRKVDAVLLTRTVNEDPAITYLKNQKIPFVAIGSYPDETVYQIDEDHQNGSRDLVTKLLLKGFKRLALFGGNPAYIVTETRKKGFFDAYANHGITHPPQLYFANLLTEDEIEKAILKSLAEKADCIVCMDDNICEITLRKLKDLKINVPKDIKIASLFGSAFLDGRTPSITCIEFNTKQLGKRAGETILAIIDGKEALKKTLLNYSIRLNESTEVEP